MMPFYYRVYGLILQANLAIPGLVATSEASCADVFIHLTGASWEDIMPVPALAWQPSPHPFTLWTATLEDGTYFRLRYAAGESSYAEFVINPNGSDVWVVWSENVTLKDVATLLLGTVLGCVLRVRGVTCLHSSVVIVEDRAIAILGVKGAGKSTTAAALAQQGQPILSDDIAALLERETTFFVQPGYPSLRLHEEVAIELYGSCEGLPTIWSQPVPWSSKRYLPLSKDDTPFPQQPIPLAAVYVLGKRNLEAQVVSIEAIPPATSLLTLMPHTSVNWILNQTRRANEFKVLGCLAATVPLRQVHRPDDLAKLPELCKAILGDVRMLL